MAIQFKARIERPAEEKRATWAFLVLPAGASAKLPTRNALTVEGTLNGHAFRELLQPDGKRSHWLKLPARLLKAAGVKAGDTATIALAPSEKELETPVPPDLRKALAAAPKAHALWREITPTARRDWTQWIITARQAETRARRISAACDMLGSGKKRVCCFDRSGAFSKAFGAPVAASRAGRFLPPR